MAFRERFDLVIDAIANNRASNVLRDVLRDAKAVEQAKPELTVTADDEASRVLADVQAEADETGEKFDQLADDARSASSRIADVIRSMADEIDATLDGVERAGEALGNALGPELRAKLGQNGIDQLVADLRGAGLTFEDIEADADELAAAIRKMDETAGRVELRRSFDDVADGTGRAKGGVDELSDSARGANSALANMVGNTAQDVGALGGIAGSAGVAIGQMAEYASDATLAGEGLGSALGSMAKVAGPIAGVAAAVGLVSTALGGVKAEEAFKAELVEDFTDALQESRTAAEHLRDIIEETGKLAFETGAGGGGGFLGLGSQTKDLIPVFQQLGLATDQWLALLDDPRGAADKFNARAKELNADQADQIVLLNDAAEGLGQYADAIAQAEANQALIADVIAVSNERMGIATLSTQDYADAMRRLNEQAASGDIDSATRSYIAQGEALAGVAEDADTAGGAMARARAEVEGFDRALRLLFGAEVDVEAASIAVGDAAQRMTDEVIGAKEANEAGATSLDLMTEAGRTNRSMILDTIGAIGRWAQSAEDAGATNDEVAGQVMNMVGSLRDQLVQLGFNEQEVDAYIRQLGLTPEDIKTTFRTAGVEDAESAARRVRDAVNSIPTSRTVRIRVEGGGQVRSIGRGMPEAVATGGRITPGKLYLTNEQGRELFVSDVPGRMIPHAQTERILRELGGAAATPAATTVINNYHPAGVSPRAVYEAQLRDRARNGVRV